MSSLATQLALSASLNASILVDRSRRKPTLSYLFTGREADLHDLEAIHALGVNSFLHLASVAPALEKYEDALFSELAKETDRTLLPSEASMELDKHIEEFLWLLSPYLMEPPAGKILEWLVRRFRIHEFNIEATLSLFLPYHESPHFAKMVTILQIKPNSIWSFLIPYKSAAQNLPRVSLVTEMLKNSDLARFVTSLLPTGVRKGLCHRVLLAFNAATLHDFIKRSKSLSEGTIAFILPALLEPLQQKPKKLSKEAVLGSYILLASLSQKCELGQPALKAILGVAASCAHIVRGDQFISSVIGICGPQVELEKFTDGTIKDILRIPNLGNELALGSPWAGSEKVLSPLVKDLCSRLEESVSSTLLETVIATSTTPFSVIEVISSSLLKIGVNSEGKNQISLIARRLLSLIQQRHPELLQKAVESFDDDDSENGAVEQLIISLATIGYISDNMTSSQGNDMVINSANADARVRVMAVKELVKSIAGKELSSVKDIATVRGTLIARLQDSSIAVLEALYDNPSAVTPIFSSDPQAYLSSLSSAIDSQTKPKRSILRLHLDYVASSLWANVDSPTRDEIFHRIFFPFLLFSKPRQKTAELIWEVVDKHFGQSSGINSIEWLAGCSALSKPESTTDVTDSLDAMNQANFNIAEKIAANIINSSRFSVHLDTLLSKLRGTFPHVQLMGYLITLSLVRKLSGERQIEVAQKIMGIMALKELSGIADDSQEHLALNSPEDRSLGKYIISKPNSRTTLNWLEISLIAAISQMTRPTGLVLDWLAEAPSRPTEGHQYVQIMRSIYQLANASTTVPVLSTTLLQILFANLKADALAFLAGIWTVGGANDFNDSKSISLLHATAFLEAHILEDDGVDFQAILPALLVALQNPDSALCQGALECISRVRLLADRKLLSVYRFDTIYGHNNKIIQYLDQEDLKRYLNGLVEHRDHFLNNPSYLKVFHEQHLGRTKADKKHDADYKHRVICYLLSHVNALSSETVQNYLLKSIATITDKARVQIILPTIQSLVERVSSTQPTNSFASASEEFTTRILSCYDSTAVGYLNENAVAWDIFVQLIRTYFRSGTPLPPQEVLAHSIEAGLFSALSYQRKTLLCEVLLDVGSQDSSASLARRVLSNILIDVPLIVHLLERLAPVGPTSSPRAKRMKTTESADDVLPRLGFLVEILGTKSLPGSLDLVSHLLDTLSKVVQALSPAQADVSYIEQLLMSAIENAASKMTEVPNISPSVIRLDILVEVIRVSANPQTFHQALLLIANLARLAPESVLYNVMPVFTFMGSNVFHRDDSYSFKVVQQTIDGIVPVMVSSLKEAHSQPLDLYLASREFLRVFSDAANHVPRHRRNNFFAHLVDVLGPQDFSAPVCMLLLEKMANRIIRQPAEDVQNSLSLPISVFQHNNYVLQLYTANEILQESRRIVAHVVDPESTQPVFLEGIADGDHSASSSTVLKRRAQALIIFVGHAFKPKTSTLTSEDGASISSVIAQLITLATLPDGMSSEMKIDEISEAARSTLNKLLRGMSVMDFGHSVQTMLGSGDIKVQAGALELLAKRLPDVSTKMRPALTPSINKALASIKELLTVQKDGQVVIHAFHGVQSIAATISPGEESSLTDLVPFVLSATKEKSLAPSAMGALATMSVKLGPRVIPFFRSIVSQSITILRGTEAVLFEDAFATLHGLLTTIPTFWGSGEVTQVVFLYMDQASSTSKPLLSALSLMAKSLAKRTPAKVLIPALLEMWPALHSSVKLTKISAYFDVLGRVLSRADRPTVLDYLRAAFKIFLEALDIVKLDSSEAETRVISAFKELVVKLNETAFKPLFRRLYDWAYIEDIGDVARKIIFGHLYVSLLDFFKALMVPYMSFLLQPCCDILTSFTKSTSDHFALWSSIIQILSRTLNFDDGGFWREDKLRQIATPLTGQIEVCVRLNFSGGKSQLQDCFSTLIEAITDDTLLKAVNLNILMHTRSDDPQVRLFALTCSEGIWRSNGGKLLGFVGETATFIAECSEDENDTVIKECFKLKDAVESVAGKIDGL